MSNLFPIFINIHDKKCVVVGGGAVAERKIKTLLKYGARVVVISPDITEGIKKLVELKKISYIQKSYSINDIKDALLVVAATSDTTVNEQILRDAPFLVNPVENLSIQARTNNIRYIVPSILQKGDLTIAISTNFPAISKTIKGEIKNFYGKDFALYLKYLKKLRKELKGKILNQKRRKKIFIKIASKEIVSILRQKGFKKTKEEIDKIINET